MTAEVAILNKSAIALAADSAVTIRGGSLKIYNTVNKLFALSKHHPVGVMIYGHAELSGVPWETVIKLFRAESGASAKTTLQEYSEGLIAFIDARRDLFDDRTQRETVRMVVDAYYDRIVEDIRSKVEDALKSSGSLSESDVAQIANQTVASHHDAWINRQYGERNSEEDVESLIALYGQEIGRIRDAKFEQLPLSEESKQNLVSIGVLIFVKDRYPGPVSGVVVAGFGDSDFFPRLVEVQTRAVVGDKLRLRRQATHKVEVDGAAIMAFAQGDMVTAFMEGVNPSYKKVVRQALQRVLRDLPKALLTEAKAWQQLPAETRDAVEAEAERVAKVLLTELQSEIEKYSAAAHVHPVIQTVAVLPKDELAEMAEALVNLTAFKQRMSMDAETVGGPIDVAVISKGDGFVWIKRKHYFRPELNPQFFVNYNRE